MFELWRHLQFFALIYSLWFSDDVRRHIWLKMCSGNGNWTSTKSLASVSVQFHKKCTRCAGRSHHLKLSFLRCSYICNRQGQCVTIYLQERPFESELCIHRLSRQIAADRKPFPKTAQAKVTSGVLQVCFWTPWCETCDIHDLMACNILKFST